MSGYDKFIDNLHLVDKITDESYVTIDKMMPMPKWVFVAFAVLSAIILLW